MEDRSRRKLFQKRKQNFRKAGARELAEQDGKPAAWGQFFFLLSCPYHDSKPRDFMNSNHRCRATNTHLGLISLPATHPLSALLERSGQRMVASSEQEPATFRRARKNK